jgi:hypothetical protein
MLDAPSVELLTRSLLLGTARQPLPLARAFGQQIDTNDPRAALKALALLGQHGRFRRPVPTSLPATPLLFVDDRKTIAEEMRPLLISLFPSGRDLRDDAVALAIAHAMARCRVKIHPFDLPRLEGFVKLYCEQLGPSAVAWSERHAGRTEGEPRAYSFIEVVDETNWLRSRPAQKEAFIHRLRTTDPARARELVEAAFPGEKAELRLRLANALGENLSPADIPFLESLAQDRAPSVREIADALLVRLPGSPQATRRLAECLSRIKVTRTGLIRRRAKLQIEFPANVQDDAKRGPWLSGTFGSLDLGTLAKELGLSIDELVVAAGDDSILGRVLAIPVGRARRYDLLARLVQRDPKNVWSLINAIPGPDGSDPASVTAWCAAVVQPETWFTMPDPGLLALIPRKLQAPLPDATARGLLASAVWRRFLEHYRDRLWAEAPAVVEAMTVLIPARLRGALRSDLASLPPQVTARALAAMMLLDRIETL